MNTLALAASEYNNGGAEVFTKDSPTTHLAEPTEGPPTATLDAALTDTVTATDAAPVADTAPVIEYVMTVRGMHQSMSDATRISDPDIEAAFTKALQPSPTLAADVIVSWPKEDRALLCALDLDCHGINKLITYADVAQVMQHVAIKPLYWWRTHGGGLRLIFGAVRLTDETTLAADEHAALVAVTLAVNWPHFHSYVTGVELKTDTRHPRHPRADGSTAGAVNFRQTKTSPYDVGNGANRLYGRYSADDAAPDPDDVRDALDRLGIFEQRGERVPRELCPIVPHEPKDDAVWLGDDGIHCRVCAAKGDSYPGVNKPGFVPYRSLIDSDAARPRTSNILPAMVKNHVHFASAVHMIRHMTGEAFGDPLLRLAYTGMLKAHHVQRARYFQARATDDAPFDSAAYYAGAGEHIAKVFNPNTPKVYRTQINAWGDFNNPGSILNSAGADTLRSLPSAHYVTAEGELKFSRDAHAKLRSNLDISDMGYPPLRPLKGADWLGRKVAQLGAIPFVVSMRLPYRYRPPQVRAGIDYYAPLTADFPGINFPALRLVLAAMMYGQSPNVEDPPRIMLVGQTGSAKTRTIQLAATFLGINAKMVQFTTNRNEYLRPFGEAARSGDVVIIDECNKSGVSDAEMEALSLSVQAGGHYHEMYVGEVPLPPVGVVFHTDTSVPTQFKRSDQLRRRTFVVELDAGAVGHEWEETSVVGYKAWRENGQYGSLCADVADCIVSEVRDEVRKYDSFKQYAAANGFLPLSKQASDEDEHAPLRELFEAVLTAPETRTGKWKGPGWCVFTERATGDETHKRVVDAWRGLEGHDGKVDLQRIAGAPWGTILGIDGLCCDHTPPHGRKAGLRFRVGPRGGKETKYGIDVLPMNHKLRDVAQPNTKKEKAE